MGRPLCARHATRETAERAPGANAGHRGCQVALSALLPGAEPGSRRIMARKQQPSPEREDRIATEIVVDCYDASEVASGWHNYLQDALSFPFAVVCKMKRAISPLKIGDKVEVVDIGPVDECVREMFVTIEWYDSELAVPLA